MTLGSFTQADKKEIHKLASPETRDALFFANADESRYLGIAPHLGWITYHDQSAIAETGKYPQGIPTEEEALNRAVKYLSLLGIDRRDLAVKNNGDLRIYREKGGRGWMDKAKNTNVYETITRGVDFIRRVDGIDFDGIGIRQGICFTFGDYGKITELELNWKGMERLECHQTLTREQMIDAIRKGRAKFTPAPGSPIEKLVVMDVVPFYRGGSDQEDVKFIEPYARITASVAYDTTNTVVNIETSILGSKQ
jgi:hypothetical protein